MGDARLPVELRAATTLEGGHQFDELGVDRPAVVTLVVVLDDRLPVGGHRVDDAGRTSQVGERVVGQVGLGVLELIGECPRVGRVEVGPNEPSPGLDGDLVQWKVFLPQPVLLVEEGGGPEPAVERVGPGVIGALDRAVEAARGPDLGLARLALGGREHRSPMPAQVDVGGQPAVAEAGDDDRLVDHLADEMITGARDLLFPAHAEPLGLEDLFPLLVEPPRRHIRVAAQGGLHGARDYLNPGSASF